MSWTPITDEIFKKNHHLFTENVVELGKNYKNAAYAAAGPAALAENIVAIVVMPFNAIEFACREVAEEARVIASPDLAATKAANTEKELAKSKLGKIKGMQKMCGPKMERIKAAALCALSPLKLLFYLACVPFFMLYKVARIPFDTYEMVEKIKRQEDSGRKL